ncbi:hypothetical protein [Actinoplanes sp. NPDC089786]|uniref:hypothetical protein n=1 Tax=Actinoplanes sp. NPDC089786 TaxID=3155185 RepID=UPI0034133E4D
MNRPEVVIFDCDGVLVDSERLIQEVDRELIRGLGRPITQEEIFAEHLGRSEERAGCGCVSRRRPGTTGSG